MTDRTADSATGRRPPNRGALPEEMEFPARLRWHLSALMRLAWPVMLSRAGILFIAFADIAMLGRYGVGAAGEAALGFAIFVPLLVFTIGLAHGVVPEVSQAQGRGDRVETGRAWRRAMVWGTVTSLVAAGLCLQGEALLLLLGQDPDLAARGGGVAEMLAPGLIAQVLFAVCAFYLEATRRPMPALWVMLGANVANVGLNWIFIYGNLGAPEMGAPGAALATSLVRYGALAAMVAVILLQADARGSGVLDRGGFWGPGGWRAGAMMRRLGLSAGFSNGFETLGFAVMSLLAARLGQVALDAYSIAHNLVTTVFMVGLGLSVATGVRVGQETGRGQPREAAFAGWCGVAAATVVMGILATLVIGFRSEIAGVYTDDPVLLSAVAALLIYSAMIFAPDALQVVAGQSVRALGDAWLAIGIYALAFVVFLIPLGAFMAFTLELGVEGLAMAISLVCALAFVLLGWRFAVLNRRAIAAVTPPAGSSAAMAAKARGIR
ncbi:MAG: MATE family efflux transporter [Pseudomonadota bacterium]